MSKAKIKDLPASIHDRLLQQARASGRPLNELLQYYAIERFLYRLTYSPYADQFVLKGALLFRVWGLPAFRPTRDIDLLGYTSNDVENLVAIVRDVCKMDVPEDGIHFDPKSVKGERIKEDAEYAGVRLKFIGLLGRIRLNMQIDIGFDDVVSPAPVVKPYPVILSMPAPALRSYPPEAVVAEKLQATIYLGSANSRMKDIYDLWMLSENIEFIGEMLQEAIRLTFEHRDTDIPENEPVAFLERFAGEKQEQWQAFLKTSAIMDAPDKFELILTRLREFILPIFESLQKDMRFKKTWKADRLWK